MRNFLPLEDLIIIRLLRPQEEFSRKTGRVLLRLRNGRLLGREGEKTKNRVHVGLSVIDDTRQQCGATRSWGSGAAQGGKRSSLPPSTSPRLIVPLLRASAPFREEVEKEEEEEEEGGLSLRIETRKRVQTNEAKSKRRRASPTKTTGRRDKVKV